MSKFNTSEEYPEMGRNMLVMSGEETEREQTNN